jgi:hypothetical protein
MGLEVSIDDLDESLLYAAWSVDRLFYLQASRVASTPDCGVKDCRNTRYPLVGGVSL